MASVANIRTSTPVPEHESSRASFGPESSIHTGPVGEDLSHGPVDDSDEDKPPSVFNCSDVVEVRFFFIKYMHN